jgi:transposase
MLLEVDPYFRTTQHRQKVANNGNKMRKKASVSPELKFKIALEALKNNETQSALSRRYKIHPNQISKWRKVLLEKGSHVFELRETGGESETAKEIQMLYEQIGKLSVENEFLKKKSSY